MKNVANERGTVNAQYIRTVGLGLSWLDSWMLLSCFHPLSCDFTRKLHYRGHRKAFELEMPKNPLYLGEITHILLSWLDADRR